MELELKTALGIEVTRDGRPVPVEETRNRGMSALGRKILAEREADAVDGRAHRTLGEIEQRALDTVAPPAPPTTVEALLVAAPPAPEPPPVPDPAVAEAVAQSAWEVDRARAEAEAE